MLDRFLKAFVATLTLALAGPVQAESYVVFDVPGATDGVGSVRLNGRGEVSGLWTDTAGNQHGFVRSAAGVVSSYEVPGAQSTVPTAINDSGVVVGYWYQADGVQHGFVRTPDGRITTYDVPDSAFTSLRAINVTGDIAGQFRSNSGGGATAFVLRSDGVLTAFDATRPYAINDLGDTAGEAGVDAFVRSSDGSLSRFAVPGATSGEYRAEARSINRDGTATGYGYRLACGPRNSYCVAAAARSFVRAADGSLTVFAVQRAGREVSTQAMAINASGTVVGIASLAGFAAQAFIREPEGRITSFVVPGMATTSATGINDAGVIVGIATDASGWHGYLRLP